MRGYVIGAKRTKIDQYHIGFKDIMTLITVILFLGAIITVRILG